MTPPLTKTEVVLLTEARQTGQVCVRFGAKLGLRGALAVFGDYERRAAISLQDRGILALQRDEVMVSIEGGRRLEVVERIYTIGQSADKPGVKIMEISGYVAEYDARDALLCMGYGETRQAALQAASAQYSGAGRAGRSAMLSRTTYRPVEAEEASEICELLATPW